MVGLHNLYWYYGSQTYFVKKNGVDKLAHTSEAFQGYDTAVKCLAFSDILYNFFVDQIVFKLWAPKCVIQQRNYGIPQFKVS